MLRGYFVGLCQLLRSSAYPPLSAARLAIGLLEETRQVARMYRRHLRLTRRLALAEGEPAEFLLVLDDQLRDPLLGGRLLEGFDPEELFSPETWDRCGEHLIPIWAAVLIMIAVTVDQWECILLGVTPTNPDRLLGFHPESEVCP